MGTLLFLLGFMALKNRKPNNINNDTVVDDVIIDNNDTQDIDIVAEDDEDEQPGDGDDDEEDITEIEENTINGTTRQVYEYYRTQKNIKDLQKRADNLKKDTNDLMLKTSESKNLSPQEKNFLNSQIVNAVHFKLD